jgi:hypothetical protein
MEQRFWNLPRRKGRTRKVWSPLESVLSLSASALCLLVASRSFGERTFTSTNAGTTPRTTALLSHGVTASSTPKRSAAGFASLSSYAAVVGVVSVGLLRRRPQNSSSKKNGVKVSLSSSLRSYSEVPSAKASAMIEANLIDLKNENLQVCSLSSTSLSVDVRSQEVGAIAAAFTGAVETSFAGRSAPTRSAVQQKRTTRRATSGPAGSRSHRRHIGAMLLERPSYEASSLPYDPSRVRTAIQVGTRSNCHFALASAREKSTACSRTGVVSSAHRTRGSCREESKACWRLLIANTFQN